MIPSFSAVPILGRSVNDKLKLQKWTKVFSKKERPSRPVKLTCPSVAQWADVISCYSFTALLFYVQPCAESFELEMAGVVPPISGLQSSRFYQLHYSDPGAIVLPSKPAQTSSSCLSPSG